MSDVAVSVADGTELLIHVEGGGTDVAVMQGRALGHDM